MLDLRRSVKSLLLLVALTFFGQSAPPATLPSSGAAATTAASTSPRGPERFEKNMKAFEEADKANPPAENATLFVGSSSFTLWKKLETEFRAFRPINRGFGGSSFPDLIHYFDRVVLAYKPAKIVVYEGTNDIASKRTPKQVADDCQTVIDLVRKKLPDAQLYIMSLNPTPKRDVIADKMDEANALIKKEVEGDPHLHFIDLRHSLTDSAGKSDPRLYRPDGIHPNDEGYAKWIPIITAALQAPTKP